MSDAQIPEIVVDFEYAGLWFQVIAWPETDEEAFDWAIVRCDMPYIWRDRAKDLRD